MSNYYSIVDNMSKISLTELETTKLHSANMILGVLVTSKEFKRFVEDTYGKEIKSKDVASILSIYEKVGDKILARKEKKTKKESVPKKETHFTKKLVSTKRSRKLADLVKDMEGLKLMYDQEELSCNSDIRVMINSYIRKNNMKDDESNIVVDNKMRKLAPKSLENVDKIPKKESMKVIHKIAKEIMEEE